MFVATLAYAGLETNQGWIYFTVSVGGCAAHLWWQLGTLDVNEPKDCWQKFYVRVSILELTFLIYLRDSRTAISVISSLLACWRIFTSIEPDISFPPNYVRKYIAQ